MHILEYYYGRDSFAVRQCLSGNAFKSIAGCENAYSYIF